MSVARASVALLLLAIVPCVAAELSDGQRIEFKVLDALTGQLLYQGEELISLRDGRVEKRTTYRANDNQEAMVERVVYQLESLQIDEFVSLHPATGEEVSLRRSGQLLEISYVERRGVEPQQRKDLVWGPDTRHGKMLHHIIVRDWDKLTAGNVVSFDLLVPSKFKSYRFQVVHRTHGDGLAVFRLEPGSWLVRQFVKPMDFYYDQRRRAVKYVGPTTVGYYDDPDRQVEIRFSY